MSATFNIADLFESVVDVAPDREALVAGDRRLTFRQLDERANRVAHALHARGIGAGDHIGLYLYNGSEFLETMLAAFKLRAVPININYRYVEEELRYLVDNAHVKALFFQKELSPRVAAVAGGIATLESLVAVDDGSGVETLPEAIDYEASLASASPSRDFPPRRADDLYIIYTGGTTGMPRGVMWRHEDVFFAGLQGGNPGGEPLARAEQLRDIARSGDRALTMLPAAPFIHGAAQWAALIGFFSGGKVVLVPGRSFDPAATWKLVERERVNTITLVGDAMSVPLADALVVALGAGAPFDTSSLIVIASAGAILSASVRDRLQALLPGTLILNNFGATETGHQGSAFPGDGPARRLSFLMDDGNTVLGEDWRPIVPGSGVVGKLARRGHVPLAYYNDPEKTAATFLHLDGERWVIPGDLATIEEDGMITVFGRGAVSINTGGEKVFPEEVEEALKAHRSVRDAVVVGVPDERWGERVAAVVQAQPGERPTLEELEGHCRARIAGYKVPRELHLVDEVLRQPSGKPDYRWAKATALRGDGRTAPTRE